MPVKEGRYSNASDVLRATLAGDDIDVVRNLHERMDFVSLV
jgi:Arc/MetJ-type ribon-helix-helix transcriptional regulator